MQDFRKLQVWEKGHQLTLKVYELTKSFPPEELYGLNSQIRRAAPSIPINLAEGCGRGSDKDFSRFIQIAIGSASETEYLLLLSSELGYISEILSEELQLEIQKIKKMLISLIKTIRM